MRSWLLAAVALCVLSTALPTSAQEESDEARFVRLTRQLEQDPLRDTDKQLSTWMLQWLTETPTLTVTVCNIAGLVDEPRAPNADLLFVQTVFGNGAYQIEHPGERSLPLTLQVEGVRSALRSYEALVAKDPGARFAAFDQLLEAEKSNRLSAVLAPRFDEFCTQEGADESSAAIEPAPALISTH